MAAKQSYILWLASWYPNRYEPYNGDFIQRHAQATSLYTTVVVFHFVAPGSETNVMADEEILTQTYNLKEHFCYTKFQPTGIAVADKLRYYNRFYKRARQRLSQFFQEHGLPIGVHVHVPIKAGNLALWIKSKWGIPYILSEHSSAYLPQVKDHFFTRNFLYQRQVRRIFSEAAEVTTVSRYIGNILERLFSVSVHTIHNVVDTNKFFYSGQKPADSFGFIHVSTLDCVKNIEGIISVFAQLKNVSSHWHLTLVGPADATLRQQVTSLGLEDRVSFTGMIAYKEVASQMRAAHALVLFSRLENFPCVVIEAHCSGLPVVSSAVAGVPEAVNRSNGILVPQGNEAELLNALQQVMNNYHQFDRESIAASAAELYSYEAVGAQIFNLYRRHFAIGQ